MGDVEDGAQEVSANRCAVNGGSVLVVVVDAGGGRSAGRCVGKCEDVGGCGAGEELWAREWLTDYGCRVEATDGVGLQGCCGIETQSMDVAMDADGLTAG